ncbi:unnamed protein product, partial [Ectocarpus sp. 13 AM-2016]
RPLGTAFAAAACFRGGGGATEGEGGATIGAAAGAASEAADAGAAAAVASLSGGIQKSRIFLDNVEDVLGSLGSWLQMVGRPALHLARLGFGLSLLFYGMAFRTFAFHVIVFRISGFKQVQVSLGKLAARYRDARQSIRAAAAAAESAKRDQEHKAAQAKKLKAARQRMIDEKHRLLAHGRKLTKEDTRKFMKKYHKELTTIKKEQAGINSINSSMISVKASWIRCSVDPGNARSSLRGLYSGLITSFTASTYQTAGQIALGLHVGTLLKTHLLDLFGPMLDPIGYRLDLTTYYDEEEIPYMGNANAMDGPHNLAMNVFCYALVFVVIRAHPPLALKVITRQFTA